MLRKEEKGSLIKEHQSHTSDTGSASVQIGLLSKNIQKVLQHLKEHPKDLHSRQGLLKMVIKRRRLLNYLKKKSPRKYANLIKKLGLKK